MGILDIFMENVQMLPCYMKRHLNLIQNLDQRVEELSTEIEGKNQELFDNFNTLTSEQKTEIYNQVIASYDKAISYSSEKRTLGDQVYQQIDKHIRQLDDLILHLESELTESEQLGITASPTQPKTKKRKTVPKVKTTKKIKQEASTSEPAVVVDKSGPIQNMEVDPNEPTYCICNQVSFGEMVGCDDPDCPHEWFHFTCVNLTAKPKGKWYCPECAEKKKKQA